MECCEIGLIDGFRLTPPGPVPGALAGWGTVSIPSLAARAAGLRTLQGGRQPARILRATPRSPAATRTRAALAQPPAVRVVVIVDDTFRTIFTDTGEPQTFVLM